ncbi:MULTISPECIES: ABC transporter ATP-binding protein [unclassified Bifidobacterium]|uniref:ABC transporter ATP-binding protein n=1 Tax=unclassified Bifidobacterium TaxID=2608897 RepID=UPI00112EB821|nr:MULTISPECIES: ABC transporter ATP-binding protein [unclassified Bifidobacterium]MBT1181402.1 ABC transporter ATP-binding protein [Bifidobacterium sp. CP2]TPF78278.1 ABC transporter [Bifidobacterium sp. UTCIF-1]TPF79704.1 ABC transporter [Bifidobacterium sp. UTCIF-24]TPF82486.1 ABC transporter [Bifidobacterium sp. UTCIF-3]TPF84144.1 ABC transporter [Bifidobacterium sp. UTCIF-36]
MNTVVEARGLIKRYASGPTVGPIDFEARPGQVLAVAGSNGAGKSTTLRMVLGLSAPSQGRALVMGCPYRRLEQPGLHVGVFLGGRLGDESMTGGEYLTFMAGMMGLPDVRRRVRHVLRDCGLDRWPKARIKGYSTGMRQRLGVAGAMLADAPIIVLDEPFNGLDIAGRLWLHGLLQQWAAAGKTVILAAHEIDELQRIATHVLIIMHGRQMACGSLEQVAAAGGGESGTVFRFAPDANETGKALALDDLTAMGADIRSLEDGQYLARRTDAADVFAVAARRDVPLVRLDHVEPTLREVMTGMIRRSSGKEGTS